MATKEQPSKAAIAASVETPKPAAKLVTLQPILCKVSPKNKGWPALAATDASIPSLIGRKATPKPDENECWDPGRSMKLNQYTLQIISTALIAATSDVNGIEMDVENTSGQTASVNPFTANYESLLEVPIADAAVMYECPTSRN
jgi:hypothetical protein